MRMLMLMLKTCFSSFRAQTQSHDDLPPAPYPANEQHVGHADGVPLRLASPAALRLCSSLLAGGQCRYPPHARSTYVNRMIPNSRCGRFCMCCRRVWPSVVFYPAAELAPSVGREGREETPTHSHGTGRTRPAQAHPAQNHDLILLSRILLCILLCILTSPRPIPCPHVRAVTLARATWHWHIAPGVLYVCASPPHSWVGPHADVQGCLVRVQCVSCPVRLRTSAE